jgi:hypothetical protein
MAKVTGFFKTFATCVIDYAAIAEEHNPNPT